MLAAFAGTVGKKPKGCYLVIQSVKTISSSSTSADGEDIVLRQTQTTRLIFKPQIVENPKNKRACVRGEFVFQRKGNLDSWKDHKELDLRNLKASEWIKLELKAQELLTLMSYLDMYYDIYEHSGIVPGEAEFVALDSKGSSVLQIVLDNKEHLLEILNRDDGEILAAILEGIANTSASETVLKNLQALAPNDLSNVTSLVDMTNLHRVLSVWNENSNNSNENFWQEFFVENPWVIGQAFASPLVILEDQAYLGGKAIDDMGGKVIDFVYRNKLTNNVVLVEIKTPVTNLVASQYRQGVYPIHKELSGAVNQLLAYRDSIQKEFYSLVRNSDTHFSVFNPRCALVVGDTGSLDDEDKRAAFELFRAELKNVEVVTFDEVFEKANLLLKLVKESRNTYEQRDLRVS